MVKKNYDFNEKAEEFNAKLGKSVPVTITPRYKEAKAKAIEMLESDMYKDVLSTSDFWILMNATKNGKMAYTGLIISHNGCLKINDALPADKRFNPEAVTLDKEGFNGSLVYSYSCASQGIYEVGEVSKANCSNAYPYAMALKRLMDRVILKNSKLAYSGIYSDSEAEEFREPDREAPKEEKKEEERNDLSIVLPEGAIENPRRTLVDYCKRKGIDILKVAKEYKLNNEVPDQQFLDALVEVMTVYGE